MTEIEGSATRAPRAVLGASDPVVLELAADEGDAGFLQPLAGVGLWTARAPGADALPTPRPARPRLAPKGEWQTVYDGTGLERGRPVRVAARRDATGARRIDYADGERYLVAADGGAIRREHAAAGGDPARADERALGAPLALALALRGVHLLHASALAAGDAVVALAAGPGVGKSTLAAAAERHPGHGWRRVADDILPVRLGRVARALPHFPQLKLAVDEAYPATASSSLALLAVVELERPAAGGELRCERLAPAAGALALARAGVAVRLFDGELLAAHLAACAAAAEAIVVARLRLPDSLARLGEALRLLRDELG